MNRSLAGGNELKSLGLTRSGVSDAFKLREIVYLTKPQGAREQYSEISPLVLGTFVIVVFLLCMVLFAFPWIILRKTIGNFDK
jgi:hypothetical protein